MNLLLWMKRLAQNPPSWRQVVIAGVALAVCVVIATVEGLGWWPEALTAERARPPAVVPAP